MNIKCLWNPKQHSFNKMLSLQPHTIKSIWIFFFLHFFLLCCNKTSLLILTLCVCRWKILTRADSWWFRVKEIWQKLHKDTEHFPRLTSPVTRSFRGRKGQAVAATPLHPPTPISLPLNRWWLEEKQGKNTSLCYLSVFQRYGLEKNLAYKNTTNIHRTSVP